MKLARLLRLTSIILVMTAVLTACGGSEDIPSTLIEDSPSPTATPVISVPSGPARINTFGVAWSSSASLCPATTTSRLNYELTWLLYEGLYKIDADGDAIPSLCESASRDGLIWTLKLSEDGIFSDGEAFTAEDAAYSLRLAMASGSNYESRLSCIASVRYVSEYIVEIVTRYEIGRLELLLDIPMLKKDSGAQNAPIGSGMYVLVSAEGETSLKTSPYKRGETSISSIVLVDTPEAELLISNFELGSVGVVPSDPTATDAVVYGGDYEAWDYAMPNMYYLGYNTKSGLMADAKLRGVFSCMIDRDTICKQDMLGYADATAVPLSPAVELYNEISAGKYLGNTVLSFDEASLRLGELGWSDMDGDGMLERGNASGARPQSTKKEKLSVKFVVCSENSFKAAVARRVAEDWRIAGVTVELYELGWSAYTAALKQGDFDVYFGEVKMCANYDVSALVTSGGALNYGGYSDAETDALAAAYLSADKENSAETVRALYDDIVEKCSITPLLFKRGLCLARRGILKNVQPLAENIYNDVEYWKSVG